MITAYTDLRDRLLVEGNSTPNMGFPDRETFDKDIIPLALSVTAQLISDFSTRAKDPKFKDHMKQTVLATLAAGHPPHQSEEQAALFDNVYSRLQIASSHYKERMDQSGKSEKSNNNFAFGLVPVTPEGFRLSDNIDPNPALTLFTPLKNVIQGVTKVGDIEALVGWNGTFWGTLAWSFGTTALELQRMFATSRELSGDFSMELAVATGFLINFLEWAGWKMIFAYRDKAAMAKIKSFDDEVDRIIGHNVPMTAILAGGLGLAGVLIFGAANIADWQTSLEAGRRLIGDGYHINDILAAASTIIPQLTLRYMLDSWKNVMKKGPSGSIDGEEGDEGDEGDGNLGSLSGSLYRSVSDGRRQ